MTLFIRRELQEKVEDWLAGLNRRLEYGGLFFGEGNRIRMALPLQNISEEKHHSYQWSRSHSKFFEGFFGMPVIADFHTHPGPDGKIASEQDLKYCRGRSWGHHVVIADQGEKGFYWQPLTAGGSGAGSPVKLIVEDGQLEDSWLALAESTGLTDLGHVLVSPDGELLYDKGAVQGLIELDATTFRVWQYLRRHKNDWLRKPAVAKDLGLTAYRLKKALDRLGVEI